MLKWIRWDAEWDVITIGDYKSGDIVAELCTDKKSPYYFRDGKYVVRLFLTQDAIQSAIPTVEVEYDNLDEARKDILAVAEEYYGS